jgi:hypothetical protein
LTIAVDVKSSYHALEQAGSGGCDPDGGFSTQSLERIPTVDSRHHPVDADPI